ncbi:hypothetical protein D3C85_1606400 [compost metagenome]
MLKSVRLAEAPGRRTAPPGATLNAPQADRTERSFGELLVANPVPANSGRLSSEAVKSWSVVESSVRLS